MGVNWFHDMTIIVLLVILFQLFRGLYYLVDGKQASREKMVRALTWRIALSVGLMVMMIALFYGGWIMPHRL